MFGSIGMGEFARGNGNTIWILAMLCLGSATSQNLVENPSFESLLECPTGLGNFGADLHYWSVPTTGTTDYFNSCSLAMGVPRNFMGEQLPRFGEGYAGFYMYAPSDYREYVQGELKHTLVKDLVYTISFYVSLAENADYAVRDFDVLFSKNPIEIKIKKELSRWQLSKSEGNNFTMIEILGNDFSSDEDSWVNLSTTFIANGTERFFTIGNFKNNLNTKKRKLLKDRNVKGAYYFLDMVYIGEGAQTFALDEVHVFKNVRFNFDGFDLGEKGAYEIQRLFDHLQSDATLHVTVNGYTDNLGTVAYNSTLSFKRAAAVADRLIQLGLPGHRITWKGHGSLQPLENNRNKEGRAMNRRVEFVITKMIEK